MLKRQKGFTLIELLIVVAIIGIIAAIAIPNLLNAIDRGKQKRSMADLRSIATATEAYAVDYNTYPKGMATTADAPGTISPVYIKQVPLNDGWGFQILWVTDAGGTEYTVQSVAKDGTAAAVTGPRTDFDDDIIFSNGSFVAWPEGAQT